MKSKVIICSGRAALIFEAGVADVLRLAEIDNIFGDVGGVVGDTFEALGGDHPVQRRELRRSKSQGFRTFR